MNTKPDPSTLSAEMRRQAEAKLAERLRQEAAASAPAIDTQRLLHELQVHQIQLEMQNEELMRARAESESLLYLYTDLYDFSPVGYCTLARDGVIQQINLTGAMLLGVERSNLIQRSLGLLVAPASRSVLRAFLEKVFISGGKASCEVALQKEGKKPLWVHIEASRDEKQSCRAVMMDITERVLADEKLRESEDRFRSLASSFNDVIYTLDTQQRYTGVYGDWVKKAGLTPEFFLGRTAAEIFGPEAAQIHAEPNRQALAGKPVAYEWSDGTLYYQTVVSPLRNSQGEIVGIVGAGRDITERKQVEEALLKFKLGIERSADAIFMTDAQGTIVYTNPSFERIYGYTPFDVMEHTPRILKSGVLPLEIYQRFWATLLDKRIVAGEIINKTKDGRLITVEGSNNPILDAAGNIIGFLGIHRDITARKRAEEALRENERLLKESQTIAGLGSYSLDFSTGLWKNSDVMDTIFGINGAYERSVAGWLALVHPDDRQRMADYFLGEVIGKRARFDKEYRIIRHSDKVERWVHGLGELEIDAQNRVLKMRGTIQDITERMQAEESQRQRLAELEALHTVSIAMRAAQSADEALHLLLDATLAALDTDVGTIWLYDPAADELRAAVSRGWFQQLDKLALKADEGIGGKVFSTGHTYLSPELSSDPKARHSGHIPPHWGGVCVPIRTGPVAVGVFFVSVPHPRQITPEQVKLLESLAEIASTALHRIRLLQEAHDQARRVQTILDTLPEGVLLLNADGRVLLANPVALQDLAVLASQETNAPIVHLGNRPLAELLATPPVQGMWHTVQVQTRTFEIIARPVSDIPEARLWVLVINDVTREREQQRYQQAQERLATVGQLAAGIAHDFNNIMGVIVLYTEMLRNAPGLSERQQRQLGTIYDQAQHAAELIRQILDFSRRSVLEKMALNILPLVKEMVALLEHTLPESIHVELAYDRSEYIVNGDPTRVQQVLMNLAVNARDAMPGGGKLTFTCALLSLAPDQTSPLPDMTAGDWLCLSVADTGMGIAPQHLAHIFEPFFTTKEPGKGTGLGLAQVYGIVKQHDGHIAVQTEEGRGTAFTIYLPALMASSAALPATKAGLVQGQGETILMVEDNQNMRTALVDILESLNYRVQEAGNGREALAILQEKPGEISLVLSDLVMPEMGGQALLQALCDRGLDLPFVVLSGHPLTNEMQVMQAQGLTGWLLKPPELLELTTTLSRALGR